MNRLLAEHAIGSTTMRLVQGDITEEQVDAIVNAANEHLQHGGGVAGAIARKGGPSIQRESNAIGRTPTGSATITGAGDLACRYVIHAVGPIWGSGDEDAKLANAVNSALQIAQDKGLRSISMPAISSGIYGFPKDRCAAVILQSIESFLSGGNSTLNEARICLFDQPTVQAFENEWRNKFAEEA